jgi:hypothetical protein
LRMATLALKTTAVAAAFRSWMEHSKHIDLALASASALWSETAQRTRDILACEDPRNGSDRWKTETCA